MIPAALAAVALLGGCATPVIPNSQPGTKIVAPEDYFDQPAEPIAAPGEVFGLGTVIQSADGAPQFCLGPVRESNPPQCSGPEIVGWDWTAIDGYETSGTVTWGAYALGGLWDGERFTVTHPPIMLALYDPPQFVDPYLDASKLGTTPEARLQEIETALNGSISYLPLSTRIQNGYLFVTYIYDDGRRQRYLSEAYGADVVLVRPALLDVT